MCKTAHISAIFCARIFFLNILKTTSVKKKKVKQKARQNRKFDTTRGERTIPLKCAEVHTEAADCVSSFLLWCQARPIRLPSFYPKPPETQAVIKVETHLGVRKTHTMKGSHMLTYSNPLIEDRSAPAL